MTPDMVFTPSRRAAAGAAAGAIDLSAIRRTDAIIDLLASRRLRRPSVLRDPAVLLLGALAADVDAGLPAADGAAALGGWAPGAGEGAPGAPGPAPPPPAAAAWVRATAAAVAVATVAGAAATTGIAVTGLLLRLARQAVSESRSPSGRAWDASRPGGAAALWGRARR